MELKNKVALVTGAGNGIGQATALKFAQEGAVVIVNDFNLDAAKNTVAKIEALGGKAIPIQADVSNRDQVNAMAQEGISQFGKIDILFNNAGLGSNFLIEDMPPEVWDKNLSVTLTGGFNCVKAILPNMIKNQSGKIVFTGSVASIRIGGRGAADYTAAKHAVLGFAKHLAYELGRYHINVNVVCPGATLTDMLKNAMTDEQLATLKNDSPLGTVCLPEDIAEAVCFLASERARCITGHALNVESGVLIMSAKDYDKDMERRIEWNDVRVKELQAKQKEAK